MDEEMNKNDTAKESAPGTSEQHAPNARSFGPLVGIIIIIVVLLIGAFYFFNTKVDELQETELLPTIQSGGETEAIVNQLETQGTSDDIGAIEEDLNATDLENLDTELNQILNEL